ncbi:MAG: hypothetical protein A2Z20_06315 [Bdellovibrionales bacterium RBG_16_40_8]|nr:MAG: hypothetical protein A2Z20_06315 [Bdellovibrionales bacterium RBG_16_40_8]
MRLIIVTFLSLISLKVYGVTPQEFLSFPFQELDLRYQIGEEWGKKPVTEEDLQKNPYFRRMANATARVRRGGTGFYIGKYNGKFIMATNHHVCPAESYCTGKEVVEFPLLGYRAGMNEFYGSWPEIDLALFAISVEPKEKETIDILEKIASPFAFDNNLYRGEKLLTVGFGIADNMLQKMVANQDSDCIVFSGDKEYRLMSDPDAFNPSDYQAWSFSNGCDVSHGDSGSAMMDRDTGQVIGIIWTGKIPKSSKVQSKAYLQNLLQNPNEDIWSELSYGVPAVHMKRYLNEQLANGSIDESKQIILRAILDGRFDAK